MERFEADKAVSGRGLDWLGLLMGRSVAAGVFQSIVSE